MTAEVGAPHGYEFRVAGLLGPVLRSALAGLTTTDADRTTVLTGHGYEPGDIDDLVRILDEHGLVVTDIRISRCRSGGPCVPPDSAAPA